MINPDSGRRWARGFLVLGIASSVVGNVADTVTATTDISLWLRVPQAIIWPVLLFGAIEVLVRINWPTGWFSWFGRCFLLSVAVPAAITSYIHLHDLMVKSGEPEVATVTGPLAIDGLMLGCTIALLVTRPRIRIEPPATVAEPAPVPAEVVLPASVVELTPVPPTILPEVPVSPAPVSISSPPSFRRSASRGEWDVAKAVQMLMEDPARRDQEVADVVNISVKTIQRVKRAVRHLMANPHAGIPTDWKVPADVVQIIRQEVTR